jgi:methionyl-tRNA formyltransferase
MMIVEGHISMSLLFVGKQDDFYCERAKDFVIQHFAEVDIALGKRGDRFPAAYQEWQGDYIISYLSPWVIPGHLLQHAHRASLNFHPGPPEYPGIGCTNFALYHREPVYGVTCHHMAPKVDTGKIVAVRRFPILPTETVYSLTQKCYAYILALFYEICTEILQEKPLPEAGETWQREPYTRKELNALCEISPDMPPEEVQRRIRAVTFPGAPGAYVAIHGWHFELTSPMQS